MDIVKQNSTVSKIMEGGVPTTQEISELAPLIRIAKDAIKAVEDHIKDRLEGGEDIDGCRLKKGAERREITSATDAFKALKLSLLDNFDQKAWAKYVKVSAADAQKFLVDCGVSKKDSKQTLADILGDNLVTKNNKPSLEIVK